MELSHQNYDNVRNRIQRDVEIELQEAESLGEITHEEAESLFNRWMNRWWCSDEDTPNTGGGPCLDRELYDK